MADAPPDAGTLAKPSIVTREFVLLWIAQAVATMGVSMVQPLLPIFVEDELGAPALGVALSFGGVGLASIVASPLMGRYGDAIGPKPFLIAGFIVYGVAGFGYLIADNWETVVGFRILSGFGAAAIFSMGAAYAGSLAPRGREGEVMGSFAVAGVVGFGIGPLLGGGVADAFNTDAAFGAMSILLLLQAISITLFLPRRPSGAGARAQMTGAGLSFMQMLRFRPTQAAMYVQAVSGFSFGAGASFLGVYVVSEEGLATGSALLAGILFTARSATSGMLNPITGRLLADRFDRGKLVLFGLLAMAVWQLLIPALPGTTFEAPIFSDSLVIAPWLLLIFILMGSTDSVLWPAQQALYVDVGRHIGMGAVMSFTQWTSNMFFLTGAVVAGTVIVPTFGLEAVFRYTGIVVAIGALGFWLMMRRAKADLQHARDEYALRDEDAGAESPA